MKDNKETIDKFKDVIDIFERMIDLWKAFEVLGKVADTARNIFIWAAGFALLWFTPYDQLLKTLRKLTGFE